jgi:hypothetical protein
MLADGTVSSTERQQIKNQQNCAMGMLENIKNQLEDVEDKLEMATMKLEERRERTCPRMVSQTTSRSLLQIV